MLWTAVILALLITVKFIHTALRSRFKNFPEFIGIATESKKMYIDILRRIRDADRRKRPEKWRNNSWFFLHDNAPAHRSLLVKDFLAKNNVTTLEHPPYSPDLTLIDLYLFRRLKSALKGRRFCDAFDISKNATDELKRFSQNGFQECFQQLYSRWEMCVAANGKYFEGNAAAMIMMSFISQKLIPGTYSSYRVL